MTWNTQRNESFKCALPNDIGLSLNYSQKLKDNPESMVVYTIFKEGDQPFSNLVYLTDLHPLELKKSLERLINHNIVKEVKNQLSSEKDRSTIMYKLDL